jgi:amino acid adenylation domain-containing protein/non-ribosomal peptide synthase protein (TIGR01720 family)
MTYELWIERTAGEYRDRVAVACGQQSVTYGELNARANRVARRLRQLGVGAESRVGLMVDRGPELLIGVLAVLKAGGAYVPLDPWYPAERLEYMMADVEPVAVLREGEIQEWSAAGEDSDLGLALAPGSLAYVIHTSGSTGKPKGVMVRRQSVANLLASMMDITGICERDTLLAVTTAAFDIAALEWLLPLIAGATVRIASREIAADGRALARELEHASIVQATPATWRMLLDAGWSPDPSLKILCGGESLPVTLAERLLAGEYLWNVYGPTETTIWSSCARVHATDSRSATVHLGEPIANTSLYVLDAMGELALPGVPGELYIGGDGLARGYWRQPALTADRFIPDPFSNMPGSRLYCTGDLVRRRSDGTLDFLSRVDHQIKLRGFRVELAEIESALLKQPEIGAAAVILRNDHPGDPRLAAYLVPAVGKSIDIPVLRTQLQRILPDFMVPSAFVELQRLPLTPNGKLDRRALPAPVPSGATATYEPFATPVEEILAGIWSQVLGVPAVGRNENFFEIGGHSLLATQVTSRVARILDCELPLRTLFQSPTIRALAEQVQASQARGGTPVIPRADRSQALPLSYAQQRLWFLSQLEPESTAYHVVGALRLSGALEVEALRRCIAEIVRRHEVLRTTFPMRQGKPEQCIAEAGPVPVPVIDVSALGEASAMEAARQLVREHGWRRLYDLASGPLVRALLVRVGEENHLLMAGMHHIVADGWSMGVISQELTQLYRAYVRGEESPLDELPIQYADFAAWQRGWLEAGALATQLDYWRRQLADLEPLELPTDFPRAAVGNHRAGHVRWRWGREESEAVKSFCRTRGVTLFMTLLAGWQALLARYAGQTEVVVGTPIANRNRLEAEGLIGFFANTLVLRGQVDNRRGLCELVEQTRRMVLDAYTHQDVPFDRLVAELAPERDRSRSPLFQVMLALQNAPGSELDLGGVRLERMDADGEKARFELQLSVVESAGGELQGELEYAADLFEPATAERTVWHWLELMKGAVSEPERGVGSVELMRAGERRQLLEAARGPEQEPALSGVHEWIERTAGEHRDRVAVVCGQQSVTYGELNARANRVARRLRQLGVGAESRVGLMVDRGPEMLIGVLAVLKAGGAYVPLDPWYPAERLEYMMTDAEPVVVLREGEIQEWSAEGEDGNLGLAMAPGSLAYVIYTSGSTGKPKGTLISVSNLAHSTIARFAYYPERLRAFLLLSSFAFDSSVAGIFWTLASGGTLLLTQGQQIEPEEISALIDRHTPSHLLSLPSLYSALLPTDEEGGWAALERAIVAGEACPADLPVRHSAALPSCRVTNEYGPTEACVWSTAQDWAPESALPYVSIGHPIPNTSVYILSPDGTIVPAGVPGELFVGGAGVARGYLHHPSLTAERFVPDPVSAEPGARLYRTGDKARWRNGAIEFLGRVDEQVKIRGYRVELGEVEGILGALPGVRRVVVIAREDVAGAKRLVAYVSLLPGANRDASELASAVRRSLPEYMLPAAFVFLDELPLTPNGKLDRAALPAPERPAAAREESRSMSPLENQIAAIWESVLGVKGIAPGDNFFALGGDSILSIQVVARARQVGFQITVGDIFQHPTIAALAQAARLDSQPEWAMLPATGVAPLSPIQRWFFARGAHQHYNQALLLEAKKRIDLPALECAVAAVMEHHDALRSRFVNGEQNVAEKEPNRVLQCIDLTAVPNAAAHSLMQMELRALHTSLNLAHGPLVRKACFRLPGADRVAIVVHHLVIDGVSWRILIEDLEMAYQDARARRPVRLREKSASWRQWSFALATYAESPEVADKLSYWMDRPQVPPLPRDFEDGPNRVGSTGRVTIRLTEDETNALLRGHAIEYAAGIEHLLVFALAESIMNWTGDGRLRIDMESHGRSEALGLDTIRTVGWFTAVYPLDLELDAATGPHNRLEAVRRAIDAVPDNGIAYGLLAQNRPAQPAEILFNYLGQFGQALPSGEFHVAMESAGEAVDPAAERDHLFEINGAVASGCLVLSWTFSVHRHRRETVEQLAGAMQTALLGLISTADESANLDELLSQVYARAVDLV